MDHKSLHRLYGGLTGEERFRMLLHVSARGDDREARYLIESTPWVEGAVCDREFATPGHASFRLASAYARFAGQSFGALRLIQVLEDVFTGEPGRPILPLEGALPVAWTLDRLAEGEARRLRALTDAFDEVCQDRLGCSPEVLLSFWMPDVADLLRDAQPWIEGLEAKPALRDRFRGFLDQVWTLEEAS